VAAYMRSHRRSELNGAHATATRFRVPRPPLPSAGVRSERPASPPGPAATLLPARFHLLCHAITAAQAQEAGPVASTALAANEVATRRGDTVRSHRMDRLNVNALSRGWRAGTIHIAAVDGFTVVRTAPLPMLRPGPRPPSAGFAMSGRPFPRVGRNPSSVGEALSW
jgi:hypothetical protein